MAGFSKARSFKMIQPLTITKADAGGIAILSDPQSVFRHW